MKYRSVGKSGLKLSEIAIGSWMTDLGDSAKMDVAKETIKLAFDKGVNFVDCADAYSGGAAELGTNMSVLALAWILRKPAISSVITGASKASQLENNIAASELVLTPDVLNDIENILGFTPFERHVG